MLQWNHILQIKFNQRMVKANQYIVMTSALICECLMNTLQSDLSQWYMVKPTIVGDSPNDRTPDYALCAVIGREAIEQHSDTNFKFL